MSTFLSWNEDGTKSEYRHTLDFQQFFLLNTLCPAYHAGFGYNLDEHYIQGSDSPLVLAATAFPAIVSCEEGEKDEFSVSIDLTEAEGTAKESKLPHKTIVLRLRPRGVSGWNSKPDLVKRTWFDKKDLEIPESLDWYELPVRPHKCKAGPFVGPLSERPYIHVVDPYDEIEIRSGEKDAPITIDDVLFACRGLCCGPDRSIESLTVLSDDGSTLMLEADIDNWST